MKRVVIVYLILAGCVRPGDRIDGARVTDITREAYLGAATWDLRPAGGTTYWADNVLLGTTLAR